MRLTFLVVILSEFAICAEPAQDPRELLQQLNNVSIDPTRIYALRDAQMTRDRVKIYFNRGFIGFFSDVAGGITGAVFTGSGEVLLVPPNSVEKRNLAQFTQSPILEEQFTSVYLRFTDQTARELLAQARKPEPEELEQPTNFAENWNPVVRRLNPDYSTRILHDLLGDRNLPYFHARIQGEHLGVFAVTDDERMQEAVTIGAARRSGGNLYADLWCSFSSRASQAHNQELKVGSARVISYRVDTRINADHNLEGRAELELESRSSTDRFLVFELSRWLKVSEVRDEGEQNLVVFQNPALEESEVAVRGNDSIVVVLPSPHPIGQKFRLEFTYQGNVIANVGNGVLYVGARGSWYPNRGRSARAAYDLTFHHPESLTLVATGSRVMETSSDGVKHSRWVSDGVFPVAGFNLGAYAWRVHRVGNTTIEVYATREAEAALEKRHAAAHSGGAPITALPLPGPLIARPFGGRRMPVEIAPPVAVLPLAPSELLDGVAESAARALKYFETLFGPLPYPRLAISQIPGNFGQGWPELVYLPTLSFLPTSERSALGVSGKGEELSHQVLIAHEVAHQWWGNQLGWKTYRDQWLSEGLASYAAALYLAREKEGERKFREMLRGYKADLLSKTKEGSSIESGGAMWLGHRLSNSLNPQGYNNIVYKKACWVFHMLRALMRDPKTGSDERFFKMLRDFVAAHRNDDPSTADFIRHAEKYMTRPMDLEHNQKLDWFFNEWVYGTGIPTYKLQATTQRLDRGKFAIQGTIEQSGVSPEFEMLVPVAAIYGRDRKVILGRVAVGDTGGPFRFTTMSKPARVTVDEDVVLAVVR